MANEKEKRRECVNYLIEQLENGNENEIAFIVADAIRLYKNNHNLYNSIVIERLDRLQNLLKQIAK